MSQICAKIYRLHVPTCRKPAPLITAQSSVRDQSEKFALELAVATDELSSRMSNIKSKPVTNLQIQKFKSNLARARALLAQLESSIVKLRPDEF